MLKKLEEEEDTSPEEEENIKNMNTFFTGAISARDGIYRPFLDIQFIENTAERPCIVFPDGHIFLETFSPFYQKVVDFIIAISDPCSRPQYVHEYQINAYSLFTAVSLGLTANEIIRVLTIISKTEIKDSLKIQITQCCESVGKVRLLLKEKRYYIESSNKGILQNLSNIPVFSQAKLKPNPNDKLYPGTNFILVDPEETDAIISGVGSAAYYGSKERITENIVNDDDLEIKDRQIHTILRFEIDPRRVKDIRAYAVQNNIFLSDEYDFTRDSTLKDLSIKLKSDIQIRPYQEKALSKVFAGCRAKSGIIVLPCGAGKTLVGIAAAVTINKSAIVFCNSVEPVKQWLTQFRQWTTIKADQIISLTAGEKRSIPDSPCVVVTTYAMMKDSEKQSEASIKIKEMIKSRDWGLMILDEVQEATAKKSREVTYNIRAKSKLGLTATLVKENGTIDDLRFLVGPKLYEANWIDLAEQGYLARVKCYEVYCKMTEQYFKAYLEAKGDAVRQRLISVANPNKLMVLESLIKYHDGRGDKILVFCDYIKILKELGSKLHTMVICGETSKDVQTQIFRNFKNTNKTNIILISSVGDKAIDLPSANVLIQIASHGGARMQEAQRLGRILRPKPGRSGEYNAFFYTLVSDDTMEVRFSAKRQQFLVDQGFSYEPVTNPLTRFQEFAKLHPDVPNAEERWRPLETPTFADIGTQARMLEVCLTIGKEEQVTDEPIAEEVSSVRTLTTSMLTGANTFSNFRNVN